MDHTSSNNPQIQKTFRKKSKLRNCWIPSHIVILGNEMVNLQAKHLSYIRSKLLLRFLIPSFIPSINKYFLDK